jgi:hypothetical protein
MTWTGRSRATRRSILLPIGTSMLVLKSSLVLHPINRRGASRIPREPLWGWIPAKGLSCFNSIDTAARTPLSQNPNGDSKNGPPHATRRSSIMNRLWTVGP